MIAAAKQRPFFQLNPFAFSTDTSIRFYLLVAMLVVSSPLIALGTYAHIAVAQSLEAEACSRQWLNVASLVKLASVASADLPTALAGLFFDSSMPCVEPVLKKSAVFVASGMALLFALTLLGYCLYPRWVVRRLPPAGAELSQIVEYVHKLSEQAGIAARPSVLIDPLFAQPDSVTVAGWRRCRIAISIGLVALYFRDQLSFRAILLHELSHIRHSDVVKITLSRALWWAFVVAIVLPYLVTLVAFAPWDSTGLERAFRVAFIAVAVYLTQLSVFRAREYYADAQAVQWSGGQTEPVLSALSYLSSARSSSAVARCSLRWLPQCIAARLARVSAGARGLFSYHPSRVQRERAIAESAMLFSTGAATAFAVGLVAAIGFVNIVGIAGVTSYFMAGDKVSFEVLSQHTTILASPFIAAGVAGVFIVSSVGLSIWRAAFAEHFGPSKRCYPGVLGIAVAFGIAAGDMLGIGFFYYASDGRLANWSPAISDGATHILLIYGGWFLLLTLCCCGLFYWLRAVAYAWIRPSLALPVSRYVYLGALFFAACLLTMLMAIAMMVPHALRGVTMVPGLIPPALRDLMALYPSMNRVIDNSLDHFAVDIFHTVFRLVMFTPATQWFVLAALLIPFAAALFKDYEINAGSCAWAFGRRSSPTPCRRAAAVPLYPLRVLSLGSAAAVLFTVLAPAVRGIQAPPPAAELFFDTDSKGLREFLGLVGFAAVCQACAALAAALWIRRLPALHGTATSFICGALSAAGMWLVLSLGGSQYTMNLFLDQLNMILWSGLLVSLPVAMATAVLMCRWR